MAISENDILRVIGAFHIGKSISALIKAYPASAKWSASRQKYGVFQMALKDAGYNPGPIDGILGPLTEEAYEDWDFRGTGNQAGVLAGPSWYEKAKSYVGIREVKGKLHNPIIVDWWKLLHLSFRTDEVAWCAGFVGGCLEEAGFQSTRSAAAKSYAQSKKFVKLNAPAIGAIAVYWRKSTKSGLGHVGFVGGKTANGQIMLLSGNADDMVKWAPYGESRLVGYYWPVEALEKGIQPEFKLPLMKSTGAPVKTEA